MTNSSIFKQEYLCEPANPDDIIKDRWVTYRIGDGSKYTVQKRGTKKEVFDHFDNMAFPKDLAIIFHDKDRNE